MGRVKCSLMYILFVRLHEVLALQAVAQLGGSVTLPCIDSNQNDIPDDLIDIQWWTGENPVIQYQHGEIIQGSRYINRTDLSTDGFKNGDFSLLITYTEYSDSGRYQCVLIKDGQKVTPAEVDLEVGEHMSRVNATSGSLFQLLLPDESPVTVSFLPDGGNLSVFVCEVEQHLLTCSMHYTNRTLLHNNTLILTNITPADSGTFFMRDKHTNRTISVVILQVLSPGTNALHPVIIILIVFTALCACICGCCTLVNVVIDHVSKFL